jgi:hypothetical protein
MKTCITISLSILFRMANFSDETSTENQNTHCVFNNALPKIMSFMREYGKIWYSQTGHG